jgi:FtsZ-binding cell division protein ZapB
LTEIHSRDYSAAMISEFEKLLEKIGQLSELAQALRRENASLRIEMAALTDENSKMASRMKEAHERVSALLQSIPSTSEDEEAA